jgi:D-alanine-D-alanine ligase
MKKVIGVVCGGYSGESDVSMRSAAMVMNNIDREKYIPYQMVIETNRWYVKTDEGEHKIDANDFSFEVRGKRMRPDLCLIMIHGTPGEDGKLQGYLDMIGMPYSTGSVLNLALTFNKRFTNDLLLHRGFNTAKGILLYTPEDLDTEAIVRELKLPVFVKPNQGGSSLGISKVTAEEDLTQAVARAFAEKSAVLIEEYLEGREFTCGVVCGKTDCRPLAVTEIATEREFFDYHAKYTHDQTREITPAELPKDLYEKCRSLTAEIAKSLECRGVVRIDYKLVGEEFFVIEVNTVPGMTEHSIVPQQAAPHGIDKTKLIDLMIESVIEPT